MSTAFSCPHCGASQTAGPGGSPAGTLCTACGRSIHGAAVAPGAPPRAARPAADYADDVEQLEVVPEALPRIPGSVKAAGIIWIVFGGLILLSFALQILAQLATAPPGQGRVAGALLGVTFCSGLLVALFGGGFILVGSQTLTGSAKDTLGNGIGSILFAALIGGLTVFAMLALAGPRTLRPDLTPSWAVVLGLIVNGFATVALLVAGILALAGRGGYTAYQAYKGYRQHVKSMRSRGR